MTSQSAQTVAGVNRDGEKNRGHVPFYVRTPDRQECLDEDSEAEAAANAGNQDGRGVSSRFIVRRRSRESRNETGVGVGGGGTTRL